MMKMMYDCVTHSHDGSSLSSSLLSSSSESLAILRRFFFFLCFFAGVALGRFRLAADDAAPLPFAGVDARDDPDGVTGRWSA